MTRDEIIDGLLAEQKLIGQPSFSKERWGSLLDAAVVNGVDILSVLAPPAPARTRQSKRRRKLVWEASGGRCFWCGKELSLHLTQVDHVIARANGGEHSDENSVAACRRCNMLKSDLTLVEFRKKIAPEMEYFAGIHRTISRILEAEAS